MVSNIPMTMSLIMESYNVVIGSSSALEIGTVRMD
jgi:hypothetical protein